MRKLSLIFSLLIALVGFNANAAMYLVGEAPLGKGWDPSKGNEMTDNNDGTYSYVATINGTVYFCFADALGENSNDWNNFNSNHRYGPLSGDQNVQAGSWITTQRGSGAYMFTGTNQEYEITFDANQNKFKIDGYVAPINPYTGKLFILGQVNGNNWNPTTGVEMEPVDELLENIFELEDVTVTDSGDGYGYFSFTTKLGENADDWSFLPYRRGAVADGTLVENDKKTAMGDWGTANAFKVLPGTYDFTVSIKEGESAYVKVVKKADPTPTVDDVYILGEVNGNGWAPNVGVKMTLNEGVYTANITTTGENDGKSYFSFTKQLAEGNADADWEAIAPYRFGADSNGDFWMTEELLGVECALVDNGQAIAIPAGEWTVTVNLDTYKFTIDGTWPVDTVIPEPEADVYILGEVNGNGWAPNVGVKMTLNEGVYTANITTTGENDGKSYFSFTKQLAEGNADANWEAIAPYRFGADSNGDFWMTEELLGVECALVDNGQAIAIPAGEWTVTVNLDTYKFTIDGTWPVDTVIPEPTTDVYIIGEVNGNIWATNVGVKMTLNEGVYTANITTAGENDGKSYFSFTKQLADSAADWEAIAPYRFGPVSDGDFIMTEELLGQECALTTDGSNAIAIPAGEWTVTVNLNTYKFSINGTWPVDTVIPEPEADVYILGEVNGNGWAANQGVKMTLNEGVYTANITTAGENDGKSYFSFTKQLADSAAGWDDIAAYRFGAESDGDFWMTEELLGVECALVDNGQAIAIPAGEWTVTVNLNTYKFTIDGTWPVDTVIPEPEADVYILGEVNGNGWAANLGVKMTLNEGVYTANITTAGENDGKSYFSFTKQLADSANGWDDIAPYRFGAESEGDFWMTEELLGVECTLVDNGQAIAIPAGEWTVTVNLNTYKFTIDGTWPAVEPEHYDGDVYILGDVNDNGGWFTNKGVKMTRDDENYLYTATITTTGEAYVNPETGIGYSYFSFTKQLVDSAADWDGIAPYRFGAVSDGDFWVTDETLGTEIALVNQGATFQIPAGEWNLTLSVDNMTLKIEKAESDYILGDVDMDNFIKISDVTALINYLLSGNAEGIDLQAADCDKDTFVKINDVTTLINFLLSGKWE